MVDNDITFNIALRSSLYLQCIFGAIGMAANGSILLCLTVRSRMRTQPNFIIGNLALADFLICLCYAIWAGINLHYSMRVPLDVCMYVMAPALFSINVSLCWSVAAAHYRSNCCLLGYSTLHGVGKLADTWKLIAASITTWILTLAAGAAAFFEVGGEGAVPICIYPVALHNSYLVPFSTFTLCISGVIVMEHLRVLQLAAHRRSERRVRRRSSIYYIDGRHWDTTNPVILRTTFYLLALLGLCWIPFHYISCLYIHPGPSVYKEHYYFLAQWMTSAPLLHAALVDPFMYALSERDFHDEILGALLAVFPWRVRWRLKYKLKQFDPFHKHTRVIKPTNCDSDGQELPKQELSSSDRSAPLFAIEMNHVSIRDFLTDHRYNGHVNQAFRSEYI